MDSLLGRVLHSFGPVGDRNTTILPKDPLVRWPNVEGLGLQEHGIPGRTWEKRLGLCPSPLPCSEPQEWRENQWKGSRRQNMNTVVLSPSAFVTRRPKKNRMSLDEKHNTTHKMCVSRSNQCCWLLRVARMCVWVRKTRSLSRIQ
mmetsp:Transcript_19137/g.44587  ORF Transcript_19137/g.44587 Transcript_19137/m.44587 type:complete len:145 (+) Transcript_19137:234-668(+)